MELWLLGAGAIVLIGITLWIVWPGRSADSADTTVQREEVSHNAMTESNRPTMPPQGDRFEDQYTSATADLSAGGVATAFESRHDQAPSPVTPYPTPPSPPPVAGVPERWPEAPAAGERIGQASNTDNFPYVAADSEPRSLARPRNIGIGAGALLSLGGAAGGAWLYARWQRERNKPINRLRRGARDVASRLGDRMPDIEDLPRGAAPVSGVATALLLSGLMISRALRRDAGDTSEAVRDRATDIVRDSIREALGFGREAMDRSHAADRGRDAMDAGRDAFSRSRSAMDRGRAVVRDQSSKVPLDRLTSSMDAIQPGRPTVMGLGVGGLAVAAGGAYLVWRLLRGTEAKPQQTWYAGE